MFWHMQSRAFVRRIRAWLKNSRVTELLVLVGRFKG